MLWLVPDGPHLIKGTRFSPGAFKSIFRSKDLRSAAFGYFGHMWELYTLWSFVPVFLSNYLSRNQENINVSYWAFVIIAVGPLWGNRSEPVEVTLTGPPKSSATNAGSIRWIAMSPIAPQPKSHQPRHVKGR